MGATAAEEVAGLDKVLTRVALTEDVGLEQVLSRLVPAVIRQLKSPHEATRKKVLEILGHVNKRLKGAPTMALPLPELVAMACEAGGHPMVRSFALVYTEMAFERAKPAERLTVVPTLMTGVAARAPQQRQLVLRLVLAGLEGLTQPLQRTLGLPPALAGMLVDKPAAPAAPAASDATPTAEPPSNTVMEVVEAEGARAGADAASVAGSAAHVIPSDILQQYGFLANEADRATLLEAVTTLLLYVPQPSGPRITNALQAAQMLGAAAAAGGPVPAPEPAPVPPGMTPGDVAFLRDKAGTLPAGEALLKRKLGALNFLSGGVASPTELLIPFLVAACDPADAVSRRGEELLKRVCMTEGPRPAVDLEGTPALLDRLFSLFHGSVQPAIAAGTGTAAGLPEAASKPAEARAQPASAAVRSRILALLCRSIAATSVFPATILTIQEAVYGGSGTAASTSGRLRSQGMEFAVWVAKHCPTHQLKAMAPAVLQGLLKTLNMGDTDASGAGEAALAQDHAAVTLRGFAYQAVGCLASRVPDVMAGRVDLARSFFQALAEEPAGLRATVAEATASLSAAFKVGPGAASSGWPELDALLLASVTSNKDAVRLCAVQWASRVYPLTHVPARWVCVLAASDTKLEVKEEASRGLRLNPQTLLPAPPPAQGSSGTVAGAAAEQLPSLQKLLEFARGQLPALAAAAEPNKQLPLNPRSYLALLRFCEMCWQSDIEAVKKQPDSGGVVVPELYLVLLEGALTRQATAELLTAALQALLEAAQLAPSVVETRAVSRLNLLQPLLSHTDGLTRAAAARMLGIATAAMTPAVAAQLLQDLSCNFGVTIEAAASAATTAPGTAATAPAKWETQDGSLMAAGFVLSQCLVSGLALPPGTAQSVVTALLTAAETQSAAQLAAGAAQALGYVAIGGGATTLSHLLSASAATVSNGNGNTTSAASNGTTPATPAATTTGSSAMASGAVPAPGAAVAGTNAAPVAPAAAPAVSNKQLDSALGLMLGRLYRRVGVLMTDKDAKVSTRAISAAGLLAWSWSVPATAAAALASQPLSSTSASPMGTDSLPEAADSGAEAAERIALLWLEGAVMDLSTSKAEEVQFAAGEALALVFGGVPLAPSVALRTSFTGLSNTFSLLHPDGPGGKTHAPTAAEAAATGAAGAPKMEVDGDEGPSASIRKTILDKLLADLATHSRAEVRCAAAVWLVSLLTYSGGHPALRARLSDIQEALGGMLGDANELTQEMASRGVSIVYDLGDEQQRSQLVQALVGVLQGTGTRAAKVKVQGDTKVFEEGAVGAVPGGGSLSTYQELCSLATELGQPDLVYKFMDLAHHQQALNTRRGAAFGFAGVAKLAGNALVPHVQQLVPKLYRYQYDPNPRVQDAMASIWRALVSDPKAALDKAYPELMKDLLKELGARLWRNRQAACGALADLIQGRRWPELEPFLAQMWTMTFRVMDDIKESVRKAAESLVRSLRAITLRLCDKTLSSPADARDATAVVLPLMLEQGLPSSVGEVRAVALDIVAKVAKTAGPEALRPLLPQLVQALLEGLSSLEDSRLNYIEQHAERLGIDSERLDTARSAASRASPLGDTLELAARIAGSDAGEGGSLAALLPVLAGTLSRGVGLNTKVGTARFIRGVATKALQDIRPHAPALLKPLLTGMRRERSTAVRKAYAGAAAQVCKYATDKRVEKVITEAVEMFAAEGADADARMCGGLLLRELMRVAPEAFNAHAARILPVAFGAKMDEDTTVAGVWAEVWEEGCSSEAGALRLYAQEITALLCEGLASQQWGRKKACAGAITALTQLGAAILPGAAAGHLCEALLTELPGRLWEGKEVLLAALGALAKAYTAELATNVTGGHVRILDAALAAAEKKKIAYRAAALTCLHACLTAFPGDHYLRVAPMLLQSVTRHLTAPATAAPSSSTIGPTTAKPSAADSEDEDKPLPLVDCLNCLAAAFARFLQPPSAPGAPAGAAGPLPAQVIQMVEGVSKVAGGPLPWQARLAAVQAAKAVCDRAEALRGVDSEAAGALREQCVALLVPVAVCLEEINLQQVRTTALACLTALLQLTGSATDSASTNPPSATDAPPALASIPANAAGRMLQAVQVVIDTDKSAACVSSATKLKGWLVAAHPGLNASMDT